MSKFSQYKTFVVAFEEGSVSATAKRLNVSPSAVSKQLSTLESDLKVKLFERSNRNIKPTEQAEEFYLKCKSILDHIDEAEQSLLTRKNSVSGKIRITLSKALIRSGILEKFALFTEQYPDVCFDIHLSEKVQDLHESEFDFAFRLGKIEEHSQLIALPLQQVTPIFCATPEYVDKFGLPRDYVDLNSHRVCHLPFSHLSASIRDFFKLQNLVFSKHHHQINTVEAMYHMVMTNSCIGMMLDCSVLNELKQGTLIEVFQNNKAPSKMLNLLFRRNKHLSERNQKFKSFIREAYS